MQESAYKDDIQTSTSNIGAPKHLAQFYFAGNKEKMGENNC